MKKLIIAATLIVSTGILPSYTKQAPVKPAPITIDQNVSLLRKDVGTAD